MKGGFAAPGDYIHFKSQVPLHKIPIGTKQWRYYDFGPKVVPPLICVPGTAGTADVYYKQVMALGMKGYRVISVDIPRAWNYQEWVQTFEKFLDVIDVHQIHIYGTSLGGFLAQLFAQYRPRRVRSLILSNTFLDTRSFSAAMPWAPIVSWSPSFLLKRYVLTGIRSGPHEPFIADSVDFVVSQVETLSKDDLASRLTLTVDSTSVGPLLLTDAYITIMDTNDYCAIPQDCKDEVGERYPGARQADLKTGGDFPFLSRPDEVNLHLQLHLRRVGVEPRPDLVPSAAEDSCHDQIEIHESIIEREYKQDDLTEPFETGCAGTSKNDKGEVKEPPPKEPSDDEGDEEDVHEIKEDPLKKSSDSEDQQQEDDPGSSRSPLKGSVGEDDGDVSNHSPLNNRENDTGSIPTQDNHMREESRHPLPDTSLKIS